MFKSDRGLVQHCLHAGRAEGAHVAAQLQHLVLDLGLARLGQPLLDLPGALAADVAVSAKLGLVKCSVSPRSLHLDLR